ncbi:triose-phosphate isomerase [Anianabacter salinae]|uniref:triose-phosphate isomerase n=1 Tax=Anianabacter salinae TaxID=2851023 RepID=UPI00225E0678|nr:triose-phosphate isomerase [Anianabacter salinae]MBV0911593.1 triose-phosphate isomerase [Anianabacter salinae]
MTDRRKLAAGNWKMNGAEPDLAEIDALATAHPAPGVDVLVCPPAPLIHRMAQRLSESTIDVGGQDCHAAASGAHTGDISAAMLLDAGAYYVILGHSERRADHGETSADVAAKVRAAADARLVSIVCVGETLAEREDGKALSVVGAQLAGSLPDDVTPEMLVIAYEPVWAIGTGKVASISDIAEMHGAIRTALVDRFGAGGQGIRILYGGSVKPGNAAEIFAVPDVDGALVGGASLTAEDFGAIITALEAA